MTTSSSGSQEAQAAQIASEKLQVPCDLYGLFVVEPLQLNVHVDGWIIFFLELARTLFLVAVNFSIQLLYVSRIHHLNRRNDGAQCGKENPYMQLVCVFVFTTSIFKELRSCGDLFELLLRCPVRENNGYINLGVGGGSASQQSHGVVLHAEGDVQPPKGFTDRLVQAAKLYRSGSKQHVWTLGSMTNLWKIFCLFFVAVPRSIICLLLLKVASGFVVRSSEETMVVDTVAALFIVDIGNFMYNAFTTNAVKQHLERMPALELQPSNCVRLMNFFLVNFMLPVVTIVFSVGIVWYLRQHCGPQADLFSALGTNSDASDLLAVFSWE
eukprot:CAMPEP_0197627466 /NCGR_PEP_ID=MMETSP1338-20131121/6077_1 /TAXON_ID=43686 ORGANISM="Pelagodinium beii, Strain RCC1491" /NCGR_SAMPLE_ID=MMETSP1338 /ASSEMBLY_ACC=CAM_ASM_000754 /LENGTH=325 /DNA_ID=CAMNT_0043198201 /DNA_START=78 /DNA_END=1055 /DNA_ORIENTATION=-